MERVDLIIYCVPLASVDFDPHADGSSVVAVREEANLAGDQHRVQFPLLCHVRVRIAIQYLKITKE